MEKIIKSILDFFHFSIAAFLGTTSWAALYGGLAMQAGPVGAAILMAFINIICDLTPFVMGSIVSYNVSKGKTFRSQSSLVIIALVLHFTSGGITFFGAAAAADFVIGQDRIEDAAMMSDSSKSAVIAYNDALRRDYLDRTKNEQQRYDQVKRDRIKSFEKQMKALEGQSWSVRQDTAKANQNSVGAKSRQIAGQIQTIQNDHNRWLAEYAKSTPVQIREPQYKSEVTSTGELGKEYEQRLKKQRDHVEYALYFTDGTLLIISVLWFVVIFNAPQFSGPSMLVNVIGFPFYLATLSGKVFEFFVDKIDYSITQVATSREQKLMKEIERMQGTIESLANQILDLKEENRQAEIDSRLKASRSYQAGRDSRDQEVVRLAKEAERLSGETATLMKRNSKLEIESEKANETFKRLETETVSLKQKLETAIAAGGSAVSGSKQKKANETVKMKRFCHNPECDKDISDKKSSAKYCGEECKNIVNNSKRNIG